MKIKILTAAFLLAILGGSCTDDKGKELGPEQGTIKPTFTADYGVKDSRKATSKAGGPAVATPPIEYFFVHLTSANGATDKTWSSVGEMPTDQKWPVGKYTLEAYYGDLDNEGFNMPYFHGDATFQVYDGTESTPEIVCTLKNTMVSLEYTEAFKNYFTQYKTTIHSSGGAYITFEGNEARAAYVKPGNVTMAMQLVKQDGTILNFEPAQITDAKAKTHYHITFDVNEGNVGDVTLNITYDATTEDEPITIQVGDVTSAGEPVLAPVGFVNYTAEDPSTKKSFIEGDEPTADLYATLIAEAGFQEAVLTTQSQYLISKGWPAEIDLVQATPEQKALFMHYGLKVAGLWSTKEEVMGVVDFRGVITHLRTYNSSSDHAFTLKLKDKLMRVTEPLTLSLSTRSVVLNMISAEGVKMGAADAKVTFSFDANKPEQALKFQVLVGSTWTDCATKSIVKNSENNYTATITLPAVFTEDFKVRAVYRENVKTSNEQEVNVILPNLALNHNDYDVWAKEATLSLTSSDSDAGSLASLSSFKLYVSTDGTTFNPINATRDGVNFKLTGLTPGTTYHFKASVVSDPNRASADHTLTTEAATGVPNGDFEDLTETINVSGMNHGGPWTRTRIAGPYTNTLTMTVKEPTGWTSINSTTFNYNGANNKNSWYVVPSTYNTTISASVRSVAAGVGGNDTPGKYKNLSAQNGANAMVVRCVAWDLNGPSISQRTQTAAGEGNYYNNNVPSSIANRSAGELNYDGSFASRPKKLNGYYKYEDNQASETGVISADLYSGATKIASGKGHFNAEGSYTAFSIDLNYSNTALKATRLVIKIKASNAETIVTTNYATRWEQGSYGAMLTIDNLTFEY